MDKIDKVILAISIPILALLVYLLFAILPVMLYTQAECLRSGYPNSKVTVGLDRYCLSLEGAVVVKVVKQ